MAKTLTIDNVQVQRLALIRDSTGEIWVQCEYALRSGNQIVMTKAAPLAPSLAAGRKASLAAVFDLATQEIAGVELA
jgi:hypothetical protein